MRGSAIIDQQDTRIEAGLGGGEDERIPRFRPYSREVRARVRNSFRGPPFSRTRLRTRAKSAVSSTGLVRKSSAPASDLQPVARLVEGRDHDDRKMRRGGVSSSAADIPRTPSMPGIITSSSTMSHKPLITDGQRVGSVHGGHDVEILRRQLCFEQLDVGRKCRRPRELWRSIYASFQPASA